MRRVALLTLAIAAAGCPQAPAWAADSGVVQPPAAPVDNGVYDLLGRIEQMQAEIQQLRGVVEEQSQTIADLQRKQSNMYTDLDSRLQGLSQPAAAAAQPAPAVPAAAVAAPVAAVAAPVATAAPVSAPPAAPAASAPAQAAAAVAPAPPAGKGNEKERYQLAYETLRSGHNDQAVKMFESLLADFPRGEYADNSQYWLGEAYKINREPDKAKAAFYRVVTVYPNSMKAGDALLKIGYIEFDAQNMTKAKEILNQVVSNYPGTPAEHLAAKKLQQIPQ